MPSHRVPNRCVLGRMDGTGPGEGKVHGLLPGLVNVDITNWNITMLLMGKSTISTGPFSMSQTVSLPEANGP